MLITSFGGGAGSKLKSVKQTVAFRVHRKPCGYSGASGMMVAFRRTPVPLFLILAAYTVTQGTVDSSLPNFALGTGQISKRSAEDGPNLGGVARGLREVLITLVLILYVTVFKSIDPNRVQCE